MSGAHAKDGLYLLWACGHEPIGLANGPIGLVKPYFIFYPLQKIKIKIKTIKLDSLIKTSYTTVHANVRFKLYLM